MTKVAFRTRVWLCMLAMACVLTGCVIYSFLAGRSTAASAVRRNMMLDQISIALRRYRDEYGAFPPLQQDGHSWRVRLLPYLDLDSFYERYDFDAPWNSTVNQVVAGCGSASYSISERAICDRETNIVAVVHYYGDGYSRESRDEKHRNENGVFAIEVMRSGIPWMEPKDLVVLGDIAILPGQDPVSIEDLVCDGCLVIDMQGRKRIVGRTIERADVLSALSCAAQEVRHE